MNDSMNTFGEPLENIVRYSLLHAPVESLRLHHPAELEALEARVLLVRDALVALVPREDSYPGHVAHGLVRAPSV